MGFVRFQSPYALFAVLFGLQFLVLLTRLVFFRQNSTDVRIARQCLHDASFPYDNEDDFHKNIWPDLHRIAFLCSFKRFRKDVSTFGRGKHAVNWLNGKVTAPEHKCNIIFLRNDSAVETELDLKRRMSNCTVYSVSSELSSEDSRKPGSSIVSFVFNLELYPQRWKPLDDERDIRESMDIVKFISLETKLKRIDALNVFTNGAEHIRNLFSKSAFDTAKIRVCQLNLIYPRPRSKSTKQAFYDVWKRILYDRRYFLTSVRRLPNSDDLMLFILNVSDPYCWAKYISLNIPFDPESA
ncbi:unnamed protein product [Caenorhabditis auriculariae]|uniref:Uncharacterized protein n=1 Tax=Caenorhabditis auriculariae TaxID=2777116 RepID=A0A8S1HQU1_9PELO|nr:unnamed protein product [Caenorhabditis auriculariae]